MGTMSIEELSEAVQWRKFVECHCGHPAYRHYIDSFAPSDACRTPCADCDCSRFVVREKE